jgi:hypothetical protein
MIRHVDNLKRLFGKLQARYGSDDPLVLQVKDELDSTLAMESRFQESLQPLNRVERPDVSQSHTLN